MKAYCVKQKKGTNCVPGSGHYMKAKNGQTINKAICVDV